MNYYYIKLDDQGFNIKTSPILKYFICNFKPIYINNIYNICTILNKYNYKNNTIVFYQHKSIDTFKKIITDYININKDIKFKFYLFTFDYWHLPSLNYFKPINYKIICFANNLIELNRGFNSNFKKYENNIIFKNYWCCYKESIININKKCINKLLISGAQNSINYPERYKLRILKNNNIVIINRNKNHCISSEYIYNNILNSYFACFSSSVWIKGKSTHIILLKTFEILGSGALLVLPKNEEEYIKKIGLINMKNCYLIDFYKNLNEQINYIFDNINLFNEIRINGQQHAKKFLNEDKMIKEILNIIQE
jgi:hypothetical protein